MKKFIAIAIMGLCLGANITNAQTKTRKEEKAQKRLNKHEHQQNNLHDKIDRKDARADRKERKMNKKHRKVNKEMKSLDK